MINRNKYQWETLNTPIIKTVFFSQKDNDYGTRIRIKCHQPMQRKAETLEGEKCTNWDHVDSFGVRFDFDDSIHHADDYQNFYENPREFSGWDEFSGNEL